MDNGEQQGAGVKTLEERVADLASALAETQLHQKRDNDLIKTAGGKLNKITAKTTPEELRRVLAEVGANLLSVGRGT